MILANYDTQTTTSVFSDNLSRPKFGQFFDQFLDMHLLVSQISEDGGVSTVVKILKDETYVRFVMCHELCIHGFLEGITDSECRPIFSDEMNRRFGSREQLWTSVKL